MPGQVHDITVELADLLIPATKGGLIVGDGAGGPVELAAGTNTHVLTADSAEASGLKWAAGGGGGGSLPVVDTTSIVEDPVDATKEMRIDVGAVSTGTVRVLTMPDADVNLGLMLQGALGSTDNALLRANGTGGVTAQGSGVTLEDDDAVEGLGAIQFAQQSANPATTPAQSLYVDDGSNYTAGTLVFGSASMPLVAPGEVTIGAPGFEQGGITVQGTTYDSALTVHDIGTGLQATLNLHKHSTTAAPVLLLSRANSNTSSHAVITDGQHLGRLVFVGHDGTDYNLSAEIRAVVDGTPGANDMPGRIEFLTSPDGSNVPAIRMTISQDGVVNIGGSLTLGTALAVAQGGTGATTAAAARTSLGLVIGTDVQAFDADLTTLGGLAKDDGNFIVGNGSAWVAESGATARASLGAPPIAGEYHIELLGRETQGQGTSSSAASVASNSSAVGTYGQHMWFTMGSPGASTKQAFECEFTIPRGYDNSSHSLVIRVRAKYSNASNTADYIDMHVWEPETGTDLCATARKTLTGSFADYDFTITDSNLNAGDHIIIQIVGEHDDTGGSSPGDAQFSRVSAVVT